MISKTMAYFQKLRADYLGMFASLLCAVHCSALPLFISLGFVSGAGHSHNHTFDIFLAVSGLFIAGYALVKDYTYHKSALPLTIAIIGFAILFVGILVLEIAIINVIGGLMIAFAHVINLRLSRHLVTSR